MASAACTRCRRLKVTPHACHSYLTGSDSQQMKCVGSGNPPCDRCGKAGRECVVVRPNRNQQSQRQSSRIDDDQVVSIYSNGENLQHSLINNISIDRNADAAHEDILLPFHGSVPSSLRPERLTYSPSSSELPHQINQTALPSIYSDPPYSTVVDNHDSLSPHTRSEDLLSPQGTKRRRTSSSKPFGSLYGIGHVIQRNIEPILDRDMIQLIDLFRKRIHGFLPMIFASDLEDINYTISNKKRLAYSICFVTARFVPGGQSIRSKLFPTISDILQDKSLLGIGDPDDEWTTLQALSVLYAYRLSTATPSTNDRSANPSEVPQWSIKAFVETYALHVSIHRSINGLMSLIQSHNASVTESVSYKKYIYWLWLFIMSHHHSVVTGTPPTIREDVTIRMAPKILADVDVGPRILQLLAEVELCLLWGKASSIEPGLGEWWCPPDLIDGLAHDLNSDVLSAVEESFEIWSQKWGNFMLNENFGPGIDFHYRFTRFCISTYLIRNLRYPSGDLRSSQQEAVTKSVDAAASFCSFGLDLGPLSKDTLRYMGDFGFVMISFSCIFIVRACEIFGSSIPDITRHLDTVGDVAHLMGELAISSNHGPSMYSRSILTRLDKLSNARIAPHLTDGIDDPRSYEQNPLGSQEELFMFDPIWDLSSFFPDELHQ